MTIIDNIKGKNYETKKDILGLCINRDYSIADLSKELNNSIPTITKIVQELIEDGLLEELGKQNTAGGRKPSIFGLKASAGYLVGVDISKHHSLIAITDFKGQLIACSQLIPFTLENNKDSIKRLSELIKDFVAQNNIFESEIIACGVNLTGRVNSSEGQSYSYFMGEDQKISEILTEYNGFPSSIENDSRAMAYGEYLSGTSEKNMLFINVTWGLGMGMILDGKLHYGMSGFSGEIGHFPMLHNDEICQCGKVGCLETGASGTAALKYICNKLEEKRSSVLADKYNKGEIIATEDIINAIKQEDVLAIEAIEKVGYTLGKAIAGLINLLNPELVVIGGKLSASKDYLMLPIISSVKKYSLNFVNKDTTIRYSRLEDKAGVIGACFTARSKVLGII